MYKDRLDKLYNESEIIINNKRKGIILSWEHLLNSKIELLLNTYWIPRFLLKEIYNLEKPVRYYTYNTDFWTQVREYNKIINNYEKYNN
jgi:hypothetical protein